MCLCLGPSKSGKTLLLKRLRGDEIEDATQTVPTNGVNLFIIKSRDGHFDTVIKEIGGNLAPMWKHYFDKVLLIFLYASNAILSQIIFPFIIR